MAQDPSQAGAPNPGDPGVSDVSSPDRLVEPRLHPSTEPAASDRRRVAFIAQVDPSGRSGQNIATKEIAAALARDPRVELCLICPGPLGPWPPELSGVDELRLLPPKSEGSWFWHLRSQMSLLNHLRGWLRSGPAHAVVARSGPSLLLPPFLARRSGVPFFLLVRGLPRPQGFGFRSAARKLVPKDTVLAFGVRRARSVIVAFEEVRERVQRLEGDEKGEIIVFPNAVDPELFVPRPRDECRREIGLDVAPGTVVLGFVGSLRERHGLMEMVEAAAILEGGKDRPHLLIVGEGPLRERLQDRVEELGLESDVTFTGHVAHRDVATFISASDLLYGVVHPELPSNPIKCQEYLACARPILTSRKRELAFVEEVRAGYALGRLGPRAIADVVVEFTRLPEDQRVAMGERGREYVLHHHTWPRLVDLLLERLSP